jgi:hypothetical protein
MVEKGHSPKPFLSLGATERLLEITAMSTRDRLICLSFAMIFFSCRNELNREYKDLVCSYSKDSFNKYSLVYTQANDSINNWLQDSLSITLSFFLNPWKLDSAICFNSDSTRLFTTLNRQQKGHKDGNSDNINELGGALIQGRWYFMLGASWPIVREYYQDSIYAPLTYEELSTIAHKEVFPNHSIDPVTGKYIFNEAFFEATFFEPFDDICKNNPNRKACCDSVWVAHSKKQKNQKLDPTELAQIKREMETSVRPYYEPYAPRTWWQRVWHPFEPKMFGRQKEDDPFK